ncbi:hypothetical protein LNP05_11670 [Klebsiella pneumoniae subsp. pneumoniae]|nr:hypothetical protein [Klebsiella pneumoniae subsp. pneumoniae]
MLLISLMLSWFSALTITPVLIKWWLFKNALSAAAAEEKGRSLPRQLFTVAISRRCEYCCSKRP